MKKVLCPYCVGAQNFFYFTRLLFSILKKQGGITYWTIFIQLISLSFHLNYNENASRMIDNKSNFDIINTNKY